MAVKQIVANVAAKQIDAAEAFYGDALGMAVVRDLGFGVDHDFRGGGRQCVVPQISVATDERGG